jgi:hypothetical protein
MTAAKSKAPTPSSDLSSSALYSLVQRPRMARFAPCKPKPKQHALPMKATDVETLLQVAAQAEQMRPAVKHLKEVLLGYGEDFADVITPVVDYAADSAARTYKRLRNEHGFGHEDAMALTETLIGTMKQQINSRNAKKA